MAEQERVLVRWLEKIDNLDELEAATQLEMFKWEKSKEAARGGRGRGGRRQGGRWGGGRGRDAEGRGQKSGGRGREADGGGEKGKGTKLEGSFNVARSDSVYGMVCMQPHPKKPGVFYPNRIIA